MRNFSFLGLSTSAVLLLAVSGCNPPPVRLVDAHVGNDAAGGNDAFMSTNDANLPDTGGGGTDSGHSGACTYGGGCDLLSASACPMTAGMPRQGCYPQTGAPACAMAGNGLAGATCTNLNDCDRGFVCLDTGTCSQLCCAASDCTTPGDTCNPLGDGMGAALPNGVGFCHHPATCTPVPAAGCDATHTCTNTMADGSTDCVTTGTTAEGGDCSTENCQAGLGCFTMGTGTAGTCLRFCRRAMGTTSNPDCTGTATTCGAGLGTVYGLCM